MGAALELPVTIPLSPARWRVADFLRRRRQLVDMRKAQKLHRHNAGQPEITQAIETMIDLLGQQIAGLDRQIAGFIAEDQTLAEQARVLTPVPGIRPTVLATLFGELPELGTLCRRKIASLHGSRSPRAQKRNMARCQTPMGSRRKVREALYIEALDTSRRIPSLSPRAAACASRARRRRRSSSPSHANYSSCSTP